MPALGPRRMCATDPDLDTLASILDGDPKTSAGGYLDLETGETWPRFALDESEDVDLDDERWYYVPCAGSRGAWQDMHDFVDDHVDDPALAERLGEAIRGRGAFRRFANIVREDDELCAVWLRMRDERARTRARQWLVDEGLIDA